MIDLVDLIAKFRKRYDKNPRLFRAPGRVNLIGEHTDYNDGFVLPMAIHQGTVAAIAARPDRMLQIWSLNFEDSISINLDQVGKGNSRKWGDYAEGIASSLMSRGISLTGADIALKSDVSIGGGLSSSAALEMALGIALVSVSDQAIDPLSLALAGQEAEHKHVGIHCGIMDQFASVHAVKDHAVLLDCRSLTANLIPLNLGNYQIIVCDSRVRHSLASSEYNKRCRDCEKGVKKLGEVLPGIKALRDISLSELEDNRSLLSESIYRRCRHVVSENERTQQAAEALIAGDVALMGQLMSVSHQSLRTDYEVSCRELDLLVDSALAQPGGLGARMTGGGFGGCTVNLVERREVSSFKKNVSGEYQARTKIAPEIFAAESGDGAGEIHL